MTRGRSARSGTVRSRRIDEDGRRVRGRRRRRWRRCRASGGLWVGGEGRGGRGGASGLVGGAREARWPWLRRAALPGAFGDEREGEQRRRRGSRERETIEGGRGRLRGVARGSGRLPRRSRRWRPPRARVLLRLCLLVEVEDSRSATVGWTGAAGPATGKCPRYGSFFLFLFFY